MLTQQHLATIRAALRFWKDEIASHEVEVALPYFESVDMEPLGIDEIDVLCRTIATIRYVVYDPKTKTLAATELLEHDAALSLGQNQNIATVILPV